MTAIVSAPNPVLSQKTKPYNFADNSLPKLLKEMEEALNSADDPKGVGLAAPQIGKSVAVFIAKPKDNGKIHVFVNPKIVEMDKRAKVSTGIRKRKTKNGKKEKRLEGCLSLHNVWGEVKRAPSVELSYFDQKGTPHTKKFKGFTATIVQHEVDHLNGILFPKHVLEQKGQLYRSTRNKKGEDIFEPIEI